MGNQPIDWYVYFEVNTLNVWKSFVPFVMSSADLRVRRRPDDSDLLYGPSVYIPCRKSFVLLKTPQRNPLVPELEICFSFLGTAATMISL